MVILRGSEFANMFNGDTSQDGDPDDRESGIGTDRPLNNQANGGDTNKQKNKSKKKGTRLTYDELYANEEFHFLEATFQYSATFSQKLFIGEVARYFGINHENK